jgi:hypothetical protein
MLVVESGRVHGEMLLDADICPFHQEFKFPLMKLVGFVHCS